MLIGRVKETEPNIYADLEEMAEAVRSATPLLIPHIEGNELLLIRKGGDVRKRLTVADWPRLDEHIAEALDCGSNTREDWSSITIPTHQEGDTTRQEDAGKSPLP